jgi:hypothetical protein
MAEVKRAIHAGLFEIRLFNDDMLAIFRAQFDILRANLIYLRLSLMPLLWMIVPLTLLVAQLQFYYGYRGLAPGESALVKVHLGQPSSEAARDGPSSAPEVSLSAPSGVRVETPAVWIPSLREVAWRIGAERPGDYELRVGVGGETLTKTLRVSEAPGRRSPVRPSSSLLDQVLYPTEPPVPRGSPVQSISVTYPDGAIDVFGWQIHWMIVFFALSLLFALMLRRRFGVVI